MSRTEIGQPAIFAMQVALAALWKSWGVEPAAVVGHSVGEIAAACVAGIFSVEEAARIIALRARFMEECGRGEGTMLAVGLPEEEALALIARHDRTVTISAFNGPRSITLSGARLSLEAMAAELEAQGAFARLVRVDHPFHHPLMRPAAEALEAALADLKPQPGTVPFFSTVTGERQAGESCDAAYWGSGIREPVRFAAAVNALADFGVDVWLELSAHPALAHATQESLSAREGKATDRFFGSPRARIRIHARGRAGSASRRRAARFFRDDAFAESALPARLRLGKSPLVERSERLPAKAGSRPADAACSMCACRARRPPGSRGSTPGTWLS